MFWIGFATGFCATVFIMLALLVISAIYVDKLHK